MQSTKVFFSCDQYSFPLYDCLWFLFPVDRCFRVTCFYNEGNLEKKANQRGSTLQPDTSSSLHGRRSKLFTNHFVCVLFGWVLFGSCSRAWLKKKNFFLQFQFWSCSMPNVIILLIYKCTCALYANTLISKPHVYQIMQPCQPVMVSCLHHPWPCASIK